MFRRTFIVALASFLATFKSIFAQNSPLSSMGKKGSQIFSLTNDYGNSNNIIELKNGMIVELPKNPTCIDTIYTFSVAKTRFGSSPIILLNNQPYNGQTVSQLNVKKDLKVASSPYFNLQYVGPEIGWIFLHS